MMGSREVVPPLDVLCVGDAEAFCCGICYSIYEEATILVPCGHSFCEGCVNDLGSSVCPFCNVQFTQKCPNFAFRGAIAALPVRCPSFFTEVKPQQWKPRECDANACQAVLSHAQLKAHMALCIHLKPNAAGQGSHASTSGASGGAAEIRSANDAQDELMRARAKRRKLQAAREAERRVSKIVIVLD